MTLNFIKMHGCGNDFAIFDARKQPIAFAPPRIEALAHRKTGIGFDQLIVLEASKRADIFMRIFNADGSEVASCGNASRCVGWLLMQENGTDKESIETSAGMLTCLRAPEGVRVDMGAPRLGWEEIPLSEARDTQHLGFTYGDYDDPAAVSMGNPHVIFVVEDVASVPLENVGPELEHYELFPQRVNVSFAEVVGPKQIKLRVWERGAGATLACGTAACAVLVALHRRGLVERKADIALPGGILTIEWDEASNHVFMTGPVALAYRGEIDD